LFSRRISIKSNDHFPIKHSTHTHRTRFSSFCLRKQRFLGDCACRKAYDMHVSSSSRACRKARLLKALKGLMRSGVRAPRSGSPGSASCSWHSRLFAPESLRSICTRCVFASSSSSFQQSTLPPPSHSPSGKWTKPLKLPFDASGSLCRPKRKERILYREHIVSRARSVK